MKNKKLYIVFSMLLIVIILMTVTKEMQNDTFFTIATGEHILQEGYDNVDHLTWHEDLGFYKLRWAFDVAIAFIYNTFGFAGIYAFVVIIASLTVLSLFNILLKQKNNIVLSFIATVISMLLMSGDHPRGSGGRRKLLVNELLVCLCVIKCHYITSGNQISPSLGCQSRAA